MFDTISLFTQESIFVKNISVTQAGDSGMVKSLQKAQVGDNIRVKLEDHKKCLPCTVESLGINNSGRLVYIATCSCGQKLVLISIQLERVA
jgi:hypothetical protein